MKEILYALVLFILCSCCKQITFNNVIWENKGNNITELKNLNGQTIIGPGIIMLTRSDDFIVGNITEKTGTFFFMINLKDMTVIKSVDFLDILKRHPIKNASIIDDFITFGDLDGQWAKPDLQKKFLEQNKK